MGVGKVFEALNIGKQLEETKSPRHRGTRANENGRHEGTKTKNRIEQDETNVHGRHKSRPERKPKVEEHGENKQEVPEQRRRRHKVNHMEENGRKGKEREHEYEYLAGKYDANDTQKAPKKSSPPLKTRPKVAKDGDKRKKGGKKDKIDKKRDDGGGSQVPKVPLYQPDGSFQKFEADRIAKSNEKVHRKQMKVWESFQNEEGYDLQQKKDARDVEREVREELRWAEEDDNDRLKNMGWIKSISDPNHLHGRIHDGECDSICLKDPNSYFDNYNIYEKMKEHSRNVRKNYDEKQQPEWNYDISSVEGFLHESRGTTVASRLLDKKNTLGKELNYEFQRRGYIPEFYQTYKQRQSKRWPTQPTISEPWAGPSQSQVRNQAGSSKMQRTKLDIPESNLERLRLDTNHLERQPRSVAASKKGNNKSSSSSSSGYSYGSVSPD